MGKYFRSQLSHNHFIFIRMRYLVGNIWLIVIMMILCWMHWHLSYGKVCLMWYELVLKSIYYQFMSSMLSHIFHRSSPSTTQITQKHSTHNNPIPPSMFSFNLSQIDPFFVLLCTKDFTLLGKSWTWNYWPNWQIFQANCVKGSKVNILGCPRWIF